MSHPIENIMRTSMEQIKQMVDVNTIVGNPIMTGCETMVLPVSKVSLGFLSGGGEYGAVSDVKKSGEDASGEYDSRYPFAGTSAAGMCITPTAFLAVNYGTVKVLPANYNCTLDRIIEMVPHSLGELEKILSKACNCNCADKETKQHKETEKEE